MGRREYLKIIKKIPLSKNDVADSIFWLSAQNGQYSCKAGYQFLKEEDADPINDEAPIYEKGLWKQIWSLNSLNKVKHFYLESLQKFSSN